LVLACERDGRSLQELAAQEYEAHDSRFGVDVLDAVDIDAVVARRVSAGGTGHEAVREQLGAQNDALAADQAWLETAGE
jgi:argininosuccinate lyase